MDKEVGRQYILALLDMKDGADHDNISGKTWLHKMMYACFKDHEEMDYGFEPHYYGMHSRMIEEILDDLRREKLICMVSDQESSRTTIHLTEAGHIAASKQQAGDPAILRTLQIIKSMLNPLTYDELIVLMYTKFSEMSSKHNQQRDKYEERREKTALSMYRDGKVGFSLAVQMSGLNTKEFHGILLTKH